MSHSRRTFLKNASLTTGAATMLTSSLYAGKSAIIRENRLPREVWVAGLSQEDLVTDTAEQMLESMLGFMKQSAVYQPDIICLPEVFATSNVRKSYTLEEKVTISEKAVQALSAYSKANNAYVLAAVYTKEGGNVYNAAVLLDRNGEYVGEYRKTHLTENEINRGLTPGSLDPPVFKTDFGTIGVQICFDIIWDDGWKALKEKGAELVFWPSAYGGGKTINLKAAQHRYIVASSTRKGRAQISDFSGEPMVQTGFWEKNLYCAPINLEKAFLHSWPFVQQFGKIREKYGRKVKITNFHEEEWSIIESLDPDVRVADILKDYDLKTYDQHKADSERAQNEARDKLMRM
ncbi:carbon-nitrogen hydrolase family protein [Pleomorphovibrio marinus]|uniref:carbon-nitrogen hydrolase family protein n=1 Tax=Pleomorphovibrio marinus TaxID=2164132 RepID=UPI0013003D6E|nr:carbon-nitrogen hydrolase family protein [Pleomorphovibrio marinus]